MISQYFTGDRMPERAIRMQQLQTIQVRPSRTPRWQKRGGREVFEAAGVCPVYCGPNAREDALS